MSEKRDIIDYLYGELGEFVELPMDLIKIIISYLTFIPVKLAFREQLDNFEHMVRLPGKKAYIWIAGLLDSSITSGIIGEINKITKPQVIQGPYFRIVNPSKSIPWTTIPIANKMIEAIIYTDTFRTVYNISPKHMRNVNVAYGLCDNGNHIIWKISNKLTKYEIHPVNLTFINFILSNHIVICDDQKSCNIYELAETGHLLDAGDIKTLSFPISGSIGINQEIWLIKDSDGVKILNKSQVIQIIIVDNFETLYWISPDYFGIGTNDYTTCVSVKKDIKYNVRTLESIIDHPQDFNIITYYNIGCVIHLFTNNDIAYLTNTDGKSRMFHYPLESEQFEFGFLTKVGDGIIGYNATTIALFNNQMKQLGKVNGYQKIGVLSDETWFRYTKNNFLEIYDLCA